MAEMDAVFAAERRSSVDAARSAASRAPAPIDRLGVVVIRHRRRIMAEVVAEGVETSNNLVSRRGVLRSCCDSRFEAARLQRRGVTAIVGDLARFAARVRRPHRGPRPDPTRRSESKIVEMNTHAPIWSVCPSGSSKTVNANGLPQATERADGTCPFQSLPMPDTCAWRANELASNGCRANPISARSNAPATADQS